MLQGEKTEFAPLSVSVDEDLLALLRENQTVRSTDGFARATSTTTTLPGPEVPAGEGPFLRTATLPISTRRPLFPAKNTETAPLASEGCKSIQAEGDEAAGIEEARGASLELVLYQAPAFNRKPLLFLAAAAAGLAGCYFWFSSQPGAHSQARSAGVGAENLPVAQANTSPLELAVETTDHSKPGTGVISVRWNAQADAVMRAAAGRLVIVESAGDDHGSGDANPQRRVVELQPAQLRMGRVYYETPAPKVEFRLEVEDSSGSVTRESFLALLPPATEAGASMKTKVPADPAPKGIATQSGRWQSRPQPVANPPARATAHSFVPPPAGPPVVRAVYLDPPSESLEAPTLPSLTLGAGMEDHAGSGTPFVALPSELLSANLIRQVAPSYPEAARKSRVQGSVRFAATITKEGAIKSLQPISGNALLVPAAQNAVKEWLYQPTLRNGEAVEVHTEIEVNFTLK